MVRSFKRRPAETGFNYRLRNNESHKVAAIVQPLEQCFSTFGPGRFFLGLRVVTSWTQWSARSAYNAHHCSVNKYSQNVFAEGPSSYSKHMTTCRKFISQSGRPVNSQLWTASDMVIVNSRYSVRRNEITGTMQTIQNALNQDTIDRWVEQ